VIDRWEVFIRICEEGITLMDWFLMYKKRHHNSQKIILNDCFNYSRKSIDDSENIIGFESRTNIRILSNSDSQYLLT
jgi:hypothetical protein